MTILGTFDSVRASLDPERFDWEADTLLRADGRISNRVGNGTDQVILDTAPKLTVLEVCVRRKDGEVLKSELAVGYAGASALVA